MELNDSLRLLLAELQNDPETRGYSGKTTEDIAADLNELRYITLSERFISERTLFAVLGGARATALLDAIQAMPDRTMQRIYGMLTDVSAGGVDISIAEARAMVDQFAAGGLLTADEAAAIKGLAETKQSRAGQLGYETVTVPMVERCMEVM